MKKTKIIILSIFILSCGYKTKKDISNLEKDNFNLYAENEKGGYILFKTNKKGESYLKVKGSNYSNHYFGTLKKENKKLTFFPKNAIGINGCKSDKYGESFVGINLGEDKKALEFIKENSISFILSNPTKEKINIKGFENYHKVNGQKEVTVIIKSIKNEFYKRDSITIDPTSTMLCIGSRIRQKKYEFEFVNDDIIKSLNYFRKPIDYKKK